MKGKENPLNNAFLNNLVFKPDRDFNLTYQGSFKKVFVQDLMEYCLRLNLQGIKASESNLLLTRLVSLQKVNLDICPVDPSKCSN